MQNKEFNVTLERLTFFDILKFFVETNNVVEYLRTSLKIVLKEYEIDENSIVNLDIDKVNIRERIGINFEDVESKENVFLVRVKFCKINREELKDLNQEEKIRRILNYNGYSDNDIKKISYRQYWSNCKELVWVAEVRDETYNDFTPDESYSARNYESSIINEINEVLGFKVIISFV